MLRPGEGGYDEARIVWNGMIDRRPALIARCAGAADVIAAVRFARDHELLVSVRGGGHNITGNAVCEGGLMIDLSPMKGDAGRSGKRTARAEAGLTWGEFNRETQAFGFATTGGVVSTTGIAGLTLGGGLGWLMGKHGLSCDNLLSADIVTADGEFLTASAEQQPGSLLGAARRRRQFRRRHLVRVPAAPGRSGAGGYGCSPDGQGQGSAALLPRFLRAAARRDARRCRADDLAPRARRSPSSSSAISATIADGEALMAPLRSSVRRWWTRLRRPSMSQLNTLFDAAFPYGGVQRYWKSSFLKELGDDLIEILIERSAKIPSPMSMVLFFHLHGAATRVDRDATAFGLRDDQWDYDVISQWTDPAESADHIQWTREFWTAVEPFATGEVYVNHLDAEEATRIRAAYSQQLRAARRPEEQI